MAHQPEEIILLKDQNPQKGRKPPNKGRTVAIVTTAILIVIVGAKHLPEGIRDFFTGLRAVAQDQRSQERQDRKPVAQRLKEAEFQLGLMHEYGIGFKKDSSEAYFWYAATNASAEKDRVSRNLNSEQVAALSRRVTHWNSGDIDDDSANVESTYVIGRMFRGAYLGLPGNAKEAWRWFRKAADAGNVESQYLMGKASEEGELSQADIPDAIRWYKKAASNGSAEAKFALAEMYCNKWNVKPDFEESKKWYLAAAEQGYNQAISAIAHSYEGGRCGFKKDTTEADKWFRKYLSPVEALKEEITNGDSNALSKLKMLAENGDVDALYQLGESEKNYASAVEWYEKAADKGNIRAMEMIIRPYKLGEFNKNEDSTEAEQWYERENAELRKDADQGDMDAAFRLASFYLDGSRGRKDLNEALKWYKFGADHGDARGEFGYGGMYERGYAVKQDYQEALAWFTKSANQGYRGAQTGLIRAYRYGYEGFKHDFKEAFYWALIRAKTHKNDIGEVSSAYDEAGASELSLQDMEQVYKRASESSTTSEEK